MKSSEKIINWLEAAGFTDIRVWVQQGAYRRSSSGMARWGADAKDKQGVPIAFHSWDTMTECARAGITWEYDKGFISGWVISPKPLHKNNQGNSI